MLNGSSTGAPPRVGVWGQIVAAGFFASALVAGIWVAIDSPSPFFTFWDTALKLFTWGLLALGLAWLGQSFAGKRHHPDLLRVGALVVAVSGLVLWWQGVGFAAVRFFHLDRVAWASGSAVLILLLAQSLDYSRGRPLAKLGLLEVTGVAVVAAGVGMGIWSNYFWHGEFLSLVGRYLHWSFFWSWFHIAGVLGLLTIGFAEVIRGLAASSPSVQVPTLQNSSCSFSVVGHMMAAVFLAATVGVGVWQAGGSGGSVFAIWHAALRLLTWGLLVLSLTWVGEGFAGKGRYPNVLRVAVPLVVLSSLVLWWEGSTSGTRTWVGFSFRLAWAVGAASLILVVAQTLDYLKGKPLVGMRFLKMAGVAIIGAGAAISIWSLSDRPFGPDVPGSTYWFYFWLEFRLLALFGLLTIGFAEVVQGIAVSRAVAQSEVEAGEPETAA